MLWGRVNLMLWIIVICLCGSGRLGASDGPRPAHIEDAAQAAHLHRIIAELKAAMEQADLPLAQRRPGVGLARVPGNAAAAALQGIWLLFPLSFGLCFTAGVLLVLVRRGGRFRSASPPSWRLLPLLLLVSAVGTALSLAAFRWHAARFASRSEGLTVEVFAGGPRAPYRLDWRRLQCWSLGDAAAAAGLDAGDVWVSEACSGRGQFVPRDTAAAVSGVPLLGRRELLGAVSLPGRQEPFSGVVSLGYDGAAAVPELSHRESVPLLWHLVLRRLGGSFEAVPGRNSGGGAMASHRRPLWAGAAALAAALLPGADAVVIAAAAPSGASSRVVIQALPVRLDFPPVRTLRFSQAQSLQQEPGGTSVAPAITVGLARESAHALLQCDPLLVRRADERVARVTLHFTVTWLPGETIDQAATVTIACRDRDGEWQPLATAFHKAAAEMSPQELLREMQGYRRAEGRGITHAFERGLALPAGLVTVAGDRLECRVTHTGSGPAARVGEVFLEVELTTGREPGAAVQPLP